MSSWQHLTVSAKTAPQARPVYESSNHSSSPVPQGPTRRSPLESFVVGHNAWISPPPGRTQHVFEILTLIYLHVEPQSCARRPENTARRLTSVSQQRIKLEEQGPGSRTGGPSRPNIGWYVHRDAGAYGAPACYRRRVNVPCKSYY